MHKTFIIDFLGPLTNISLLLLSLLLKSSKSTNKELISAQNTSHSTVTLTLHASKY